MSKKIHVRPGKSQSKAGFVVGIFICLIGLFVVIPTFGLFGVFGTVIAGWIAYVHYRNGFTDKQIDSHVIEIDENEDGVTVTTHNGFMRSSYEIEENTYRKDTANTESVENRLKRLQSLYDQALITREEYEQKKKDILDEL